MNILKIIYKFTKKYIHKDCKELNIVNSQPAHIYH